MTDLVGTGSGDTSLGGNGLGGNGLMELDLTGSDFATGSGVAEPTA
ncbi:MAG: hypothetical protein HOE62_07150 [Alphaproteobacteria bacterium]|jgi:hypothetical protein|nr:hypothetical protein [Alphaproteobacteria bacterium]MBT5918171.1 hypothetical protein [Alphaproteobacteria bacterium]MBT6387913.1 hypothetical protein [Alphaproteobacteria bacterium]